MAPWFTLPFLYLSPKKFIYLHTFYNSKYTAWSWLPNDLFCPFNTIRGHIFNFSDSSSWSVTKFYTSPLPNSFYSCLEKRWCPWVLNTTIAIKGLKWKEVSSTSSQIKVSQTLILFGFFFFSFLYFISSNPIWHSQTFGCLWAYWQSI